MLYLCSHGADGHQQARLECASTAALYTGLGCGCHTAGDPQGAADARPNFAAGGTRQAVWAESSSGAGALRQLETEGLVVSYPHRGAVVARLSPEDIEEVFLIRITLETTLLRLAVPKLSDQDFRKAQAVLEQTDHDPNPAHSAELNWAFHEILYLPAGMPRMLSLVKTLHNHALRYHLVGFIALGFKEQSQGGHRRILDACRNRDESAALAALTEHLSESGKSIVCHVRQAMNALDSEKPLE